MTLKACRDIIAAPGRHPFNELLVFNLPTESRQLLAPGSLPAKIIELLFERHVDAQRRETAIEIHLVPMVAKTRGQGCGTTHADLPFRLAIRDRLEVTVVREQRRGGLASPARDSW